MPQPDHVSALGAPDPAELDNDIKAVFDKCAEKIGFVPNALRAYSLRPNKMRNFRALERADAGAFWAQHTLTGPAAIGAGSRT
jgi:hypothetical protein